MAKQIKTEEENPSRNDTAAENVSMVEPHPVTEKAGKPSEEIKPDGYVLSLLQAFPSYEKLYIDKQGGVYTPDTPGKLRPMAALYTNPYFKP